MTHNEKRKEYFHIGIPEEEKGTESIVKAIIIENFPTQGREMNIHSLRSKRPQRPQIG